MSIKQYLAYMEIVLDISKISAFLSQPADVIVYRMAVVVGWIPLALTFLWGIKELWMDYIGGQWTATQKFVLLAIDVPRDNRQTPKAVENLFSYLLGAHGTFNLIETYWIGMYQLQISFEIVSIEGYTQFLVYTPDKFRNMVEAAVYSQYPDAEITEVEDYTQGIPNKYPDEEYDIWGAEFIQVRPSAYPIRTYKHFEEQISEQEVRFKDPMAALMSLCSSLERGEQLWYQICLRPIGFEWTGIGEEEVKNILGEKAPAKKGILDFLLGGIAEIFNTLTGAGAGAAVEEKKDEALKMMNLKPQQKKQVEAISEKVSKVSYQAKIRFIYVAKKDVMNKPKVVNGFVGFMKQFADTDLNNFKPDTSVTGTSTHYFFKESRLNFRKLKMMVAYKFRSMQRGRKPSVVNVEELATIWHFPVEPVVRAPLLQKAAGRKSEAPMDLPIESEEVREVPMDDVFAGLAPFEEEEGTGAGEKAPDRSEASGDDIFGAVDKEIEEKRTGSNGIRISVKSAAVRPPGNQAEDEKNGAPPENLPFA